GTGNVVVALHGFKGTQRTCGIAVEHWLLGLALGLGGGTGRQRRAVRVAEGPRYGTWVGRGRARAVRAARTLSAMRDGTRCGEVGEGERAQTCQRDAARDRRRDARERACARGLLRGLAGHRLSK